MLYNFSQVLDKARSAQKVKLAVAAAQDVHVLKSVHQAYVEGIADAILVGPEAEIVDALEFAGISSNLFEIVNVDGDLAEQARRTVELVIEGRAQVLMKGQVDTSILLKAVLKAKPLRTGRTMSVVGVLEVPSYAKFLLVTDAGMIVEPNLEEKKQIIENAVTVALALDIETPKVAVLCAKEKVDPKMVATLDAQSLVEMNRCGDLQNCLVGGPFALDNAISKEAAMLKGIDDPVAGDADIILAPDLVSGNALYKALVFLAGAKSAGILVGAKVPLVLTSRADSEATKMHSIAIAALMASLNLH